MTSKNFVIWLRGFTAAANNFTLTPEQWDTLKDELAQVHDDEDESDDDLENDFFGYETDEEYRKQWLSTSTDKQLLKD